jgi:hypothetical protein
MQRLLPAFAVLLLTFPPATPVRTAEPRRESDGEGVALADADWPWWRGPGRNGVADARQKPPLKWSDSENVLWKSPVPGRGHGSPTVVGDQVFLATADHDKQVQSVLCYDRRTGERLRASTAKRR